MIRQRVAGLQQVCMFIKADNEQGFIQCTIKPIFQSDFERLGFVDNVSDIEKEKQRRTRRTKEQMKLDSEL